MDLDNFNCPQYVRFSSESFQDSLINYANGSENETTSMNQDSLIEGEMTPEEPESLSIASTEEEFIVHTRSSRSQTSKMKTKVTIPKPFQFKTDNRLKNKDTISANEEKDFVSQLRQHTAPQSTTSGATKVKPFNLTESKTKKGEGSYVTLAQQIKAFQKTPDRYHSSANKEFQPQSHWSPPKLRPRTPKLQAAKRRRVINILSREEQEAKELEEMKAYEFHAQPIDPRVYKPIIEKRESKPSTKPKEPTLKTSQRPTVQRSTAEESCASYEFHARPVPKNMLLGPTGLGQKPEVKITQAISPKFCTNKRLEKRKLIEEQQEQETIAKKGKMELNPPKQNKKGKPKAKIVRAVPTLIKPFSFDQADKKRYCLKEKKITEEIEKENKPFIFKAQPLPSPSVSGVPKVEKKPITKPEPFNFTCSLPLEIIVKEERFSFKAQPATVLTKEPFVPEKPHKHTTDIKKFDLNTDRRASERLRLQEQKDAEERENEQIRLARKILEEEEERKEILKLRQELVHKANPIRQYKTVEIKPSSKQLTDPVTPRFETVRRLRNRNA